MLTLFHLRQVANALRDGVVMRFLCLSLMILLRSVWSLHRHESNAFLMHCTKLHVHIIHSHRIHLRVPCMMCMLRGVFRIRSIREGRDGIVRGRCVCVPVETKPLSTGTRCGVRRSAVGEYAHPQQTPLKLHDETWAYILRNQGLQFSQEEEIVPVCAVAVACPSCPDHSSGPPEPGILIRNIVGWTLEEKTEGSGVWLLRGALKGENLFSSLFFQRETG